MQVSNLLRDPDPDQIEIKDPELSFWDPAVLKELQQVENYLENTYGAEITYLEAPMLELSATLIRNNRKNGITIRYLVPDKVKEEIENNNYFKE